VALRNLQPASRPKFSLPPVPIVRLR